MKFILIVSIILGSAINTFAATDKIFCYYGSWANYRQGNAKFNVEDIDTSLCTHIIYSFIGLSSTGDIKILDSWNEIDLKALSRFVGLKKLNPNLKVMVAMGGWNEGSAVYSSVASSASLRTRLATNVVNFCKQYGFDGFDLDWEYPADRGGASIDKVNYVELLKEFKAKFDPEGLILTAAVGTSASRVATSYDVQNMNRYLTYILLMAYDLRGSYDGVTGQNAGLYASSRDASGFSTLNINSIISNWISQGASPSKLVMGIPLYGHSFKLSNPSNNQVGASVSGAGLSGQYTGEAGNMMYLEICETLGNGGWTQVWDDEQKVPYAYKGDQWIGYDNAQSVKLKAEFATGKSLGGVMVWSLEQDDAKGVCGGGKFPLMTAIRAGLSGSSSGSVTPSNPVVTTAKPSTVTTTQSAATTKATVKPPTSGSICTAEGYVRDPSDCSVFYFCQASSGSFVQNKFSCPSGLVYNNKQFYCDWPANVQC